MVGPPLSCTSLWSTMRGWRLGATRHARLHGEAEVPPICVYSAAVACPSSCRPRLSRECRRTVWCVVPRTGGSNCWDVVGHWVVVSSLCVVCFLFALCKFVACFGLLLACILRDLFACFVIALRKLLVVLCSPFACFVLALSCFVLAF